jgi:hypothetical protein
MSSQKFEHMLLKDKIMGIKCNIVKEKHDSLDDELVIIMNNNHVCIKAEHIKALEPCEKFAVCGESPFYLGSSGIHEIIGPSKSNNFLVKVNSRGYLHEFLVPEKDVLFLE